MARIEDGSFENILAVVWRASSGFAIEMVRRPRKLLVRHKIFMGDIANSCYCTFCASNVILSVSFTRSRIGPARSNVRRSL